MAAETQQEVTETSRIEEITEEAFLVDSPEEDSTHRQ